MLSWKLKTSNYLPIGLDIGHSSVKMIQLAVIGSQMSVVAADKVTINYDAGANDKQRKDFVISAIKQVLADNRFCGRNVVSCVPNDRLKITSLRLADTETAQIEEFLKKEVVHRFGLDPDKDSIHYLTAGSVRQGDEVRNELILFATDNETIKGHIAMLEEAGLRPVAIDTVPCALFRSFERLLRRQEDRERTVVFVNVASRFTTVVFGRGAEISFVKHIPIGGEKFNREIAFKLGVSISEVQTLRDKLHQRSNLTSSAGPGESAFEENNAEMPQSQGSRPDESAKQVIVDTLNTVAEELAREVSLCFRYYTVTFRGKRVDKMVLAGGQAYEDILLNVLKKQLAVEIELAQPLRGFDTAGIRYVDRRGLFCEWAVAVGLSLKGWDGSAGQTAAEAILTGTAL
jgi:type IV pilus assembly protein PilM